ncbi:hypothetical protein GWK47_044016 [Chionoecetes opilio]|uniref:Uncharacterized protein n=1 Tax=Chionoecetes opilio TaxID=41210 RepID=A0A8J5CVW7_CHIOP|nr:hypothetical protein GWK47_044016 [Chionoecetes opilio]
MSQLFHLKQNLLSTESFKKTCEACCAIWTRARIPTQRLDSCVRKLEKLIREYQNLKKSRKRGDTQARIFQDSLGDLFDIGASDIGADDLRRGSRVLPNATRGRHLLQHVWP